MKLKQFILASMAMLLCFVSPSLAQNAKYEQGQLPDAEVINLGRVTVGPNEANEPYKTESYYVYDLLGNQSQKLTSCSDAFSLQIAMNFKAKDTAEEAATNSYANYTTDFFIKMTGMSGNSFEANGCYIAGYYASYGAWVKIPLDGFTVENGQVYPVITAAGFDFKYTDICSSVKDFICGIYLTPEVLAANPDLKVELTLGLSENIDEALACNFTKVDGYTYTVSDLKGALPNAQVSNLGKVSVGPNESGVFQTSQYYVYDLVGSQKLTESTNPFDLQIAMQFQAKDSEAEAAKNFYAGYTTDFFIQMTGVKDGSFEANGCYLAGYYPSFESWVKIPLDGFTVENGKVYPVITAAGFDFKYTDICSSVKDFICGIYLTPEILAANPDLNVKLSLGLSLNKDAALNGEFVVVDSYTYEVFDLKGVTIKTEIEDEVSNEIVNNEAVLDYPVELPEAVKDFVITLTEVTTSESATTKVTFNVEPKDANGEKVSTPSEAITFRLPVPSAWSGKAKVTHEGDYFGTYDIQGEGTAKYVEVTSESFSTYAVEAITIGESAVALVEGTAYDSFSAAYTAAQVGNTIELLKDVKLTDKLTIDKSITIDGKGHSIIADETAVWYTVSGKLNIKSYKTHLLGVNASGITLKDVVLNNNDNAAGINVYCAQNVVFDNVSIINATKGFAALTVNGSTLTLKNAFSALGNNIAMDISNGSGVTSDLGVTVEEGTEFDLGNKTVKFASVANVHSGAYLPAMYAVRSQTSSTPRRTGDEHV